MRLSIILILSLFALTTKGQTDVPFKGANRIVFICSDSTEILYKRLGQYLMSKGYTIDADKDFLNIKTKDRELSRYNMTFRINCVIKENKILFTMVVYAETMKVTMDWYYRKTETFKNVHDDFIRSMEDFVREKTYYEKY